MRARIIKSNSLASPIEVNIICTMYAARNKNWEAIKSLIIMAIRIDLGSESELLSSKHTLNVIFREKIKLFSFSHRDLVITHDSHLSVADQ